MEGADDAAATSIQAAWRGKCARMEANEGGALWGKSSAAAEIDWPQYRKVLLAGCIGNVLEWYDFALYGAFAPVFARIFFAPCKMDTPETCELGWDASHCTVNEDHLASTVLPPAGPLTGGISECCQWAAGDGGASSWADGGMSCSYSPIEKGALLKFFATFGAAFIMRPLGGVIMGMIGDQYGRKKALQISIGLMLIPSLGLAALPSYDSIGMAAPIVLLLIRLIQGAAAGGELVGSILFIVESAPEDKRGLLGAFCFTFAIIGTMMGTLAASIVSSVLSESEAEDYGWRLAFLFGFLLGISGLWLRKGLEESEEFLAAQKEREESPDETIHVNPLTEALTKYPKQVGFVVAVCSIWCCGFYTCFIWIGTLYGIMDDPESHGHHEAQMCEGQTSTEDATISKFVTPFEQMVLVVLFPALGHASDQLRNAPDRRLRVMLCGTIGLALTAGPLYALIQDSPTTVTAMFVQTIWAVCMASIGGPMSAWFVEFFPPLVRYSAVGIGYNLSQAIFGGTAPLIATALISCHCCADSLAPMYWVSFVCLVSAVGIMGARSQTLRDARQQVDASGGGSKGKDSTETEMDNPLQQDYIVGDGDVQET